MTDSDDQASRRAYHEAGRALALYILCFNLAQAAESPAGDIPALLGYCRGFAGLSVQGARTNWRDVAEFWRATAFVFLGGCAAERIKWKIAGAPSFSDAEFEKAYYAQQWLWVDVDENPGKQQILAETLAGLSQATQKLESHWKAVEALATALLRKSELSAEETFQIISANIDAEKLEAQRKARPARSPGNVKVNVTTPAAPRPRLAVNYETIQDWDLESSNFTQCCDGNGDAFPFKCSLCGHIMVFCYDCGTLYPDLQNTRILQLRVGHFHCPQCQHEFEDDFMKNPAYCVTPAEWKRAGYASLLNESGKKKLPCG